MQVKIYQIFGERMADRMSWGEMPVSDVIAVVTVWGCFEVDLERRVWDSEDE